MNGPKPQLALVLGELLGLHQDLILGRLRHEKTSERSFRARFNSGLKPSIKEQEGLVCDRCHSPCSLFLAEKGGFRDRCSQVAVAKALMAKASGLFAKPAEIQRVDVPADKLPR
jgi:hypothetical protein